MSGRGRVCGGLVVAAMLLAGALACAAGARTDRTSSSQGDPAERGAVLAVVTAFQETWNRHDMEAFAALFHEDAVWVNWRGTSWRGARAIQEGHAAIHRTFYKSSRLSVPVVEDLTFVAPDTAIAHVREDLTGDERAPGQTFRYRKTMVLTKRAGAWRIAAGHNTRLQEGVN